MQCLMIQLTRIRRTMQTNAAAVVAQVEYKKKIAEHAELLDSFVMETLKGEIAELREDRKLQEGNSLRR